MECGACARNCPSGAISVRAGVGCAYALLMSELRRGEKLRAPECG
ncbi:MAG: 4Fe-4S binding protein, partial [Candidatus Aminicenantales bacterium]